MSHRQLRGASRAPAGLLVLVCLLAAASCSGSKLDPNGGLATLFIRANVSGTSVTTVVVDVTAPDIPTPLVFNIAVTGGVAQGSITVPAGSHRTIEMRGFDAGGVQTHDGSVTLDVHPGANPTIAMVLQPLTGELPINVTFGSFSVTVTPSPSNIVVNQTVQLAASIKDWNGNPTTGSVSWATHDPGIATVDASGLVTARGAGNTTIAATFQGVAGTATVSVTP